MISEDHVTTMEWTSNPNGQLISKNKRKGTVLENQEKKWSDGLQ